MNNMGQKWGDALCDRNLVQRIEVKRVRIDDSVGSPADILHTDPTKCSLSYNCRVLQFIICRVFQSVIVCTT